MLAVARRIGAFAMVLICAVSYVNASHAEGVPTHGSTPLSRRTRVALRIEGELSRAQREALATLLEVDFRRRDLTLSMETSGGDVREWIDRARSDERALLVAVLDASHPGSWQLSIVDAARGRAITRPLLGGLEANAAALEAVASIVSSAASALKDGLEVASKPIDEVVISETKQSALPAAEPAPPRPAPKVALRSALAATAATFTEGARITGGFSAAIGVAYQSFGIRLSGARYLPARIDTPFGGFDVHRTVAAVSAGPTFTLGRLELEPEGAVVGELLRRSDALAGLNASASGDRTLHRIGAMIDLRIRYRLGGPVAVEWTGAASYFPQQVRFLAANAQISELSVVWPWSVSSQIGLEVRAP